jgi:ribulose-5-phosphate 4-epimerase/fuculose-1-phosphate aldolase
MGHTGDAASLGHGHIEIGFSDAAGDPLNHHGPLAWTPSGDAMRHLIIALRKAYEAALKKHSGRSPTPHSLPSTVINLRDLSPYAVATITLTDPDGVRVV